MKHVIAIATSLALVGISAGARAQERVAPVDEQTTLATHYGMSVLVGGGIGDFTSARMRDLTGTAGTWEARATFGTLLPIAVEAAYFGSAQSIDSMGVDPDAYLLTTGLEGDLRVNLVTTGLVQPYLFGGAGWSRLELANSRKSVTNMRDLDDFLVVPAGVGVALRLGQLLVDLRGTYRFAFYDDLLTNKDDVGDPGDDGLDTWSVALRAGVEF